MCLGAKGKIASKLKQIGIGYISLRTAVKSAGNGHTKSVSRPLIHVRKGGGLGLSLFLLVRQ